MLQITIAFKCIEFNGVLQQLHYFCGIFLAVSPPECQSLSSKQKITLFCLNFSFLQKRFRIMKFHTSIKMNSTHVSHLNGNKIVLKIDKTYKFSPNWILFYKNYY